MEFHRKVFIFICFLQCRIIKSEWELPTELRPPSFIFSITSGFSPLINYVPK